MKNSIAIKMKWLVLIQLLYTTAVVAQKASPPRVAYVSANWAFHVPELKGGMAVVKDMMRVSLFGYNNKELTPVDSLNPALFDLILVEKSEVATEKWYNRYKNLLRTKTLYVYTPLVFDGNVSNNQYPELAGYIKNGSTLNSQRLFQYIGYRFFNLPFAILPAVERPVMAYYHPDAPCLFYSLQSYEKWYRSSKKRNPAVHTADPDSLNVGIVFSSFSYLEKNYAPVDSLIRSIESHGHNAYALMRSGTGAVDSMLQLNGVTKVDAVIMVLSSFRFADYEVGIRQLQKVNVPLLSAFNHFDYTPEEWEKSLDGFSLTMGAMLTPMFKDGIFEPMVISGSYKNSDGKRTYVPIMYQLNWRVDRALAWARLHRLHNRDKRMMITFYSEDGGKANVGSHPANYFNAPASLVKLLDSMKNRGWNVGDKPLPDAKEMARLLAVETSNVGNWAQGEIDRRVKAGNIVMIPEKQYQQWFAELPARKQKQMTDSWGPPPGKVMVYTAQDGQRFITIPKLVFGNVLLAPNPDWGYLQNSKLLYSNTKLPPSHQYYAFYCWFQKVYQPHVRFSIFNNLEVMEHKFTGPSKKDWLGLLTGNYPNIHIGMLMSGEGGKEIMSDLPVTYFNTIVPSGLNPNLTELRLKIKQLKDQVTPELKVELKKGIIAETKRLQLKPDVDSMPFDSLLADLQKYFYQVDISNMPGGTHTLGEVPDGEIKVAMVRAMLGPEFETVVAPYIPAENSGEAVQQLLNDVLLNNKESRKAQQVYLTEVSDTISRKLQLAIEYSRRIDASKNEITQYLNAFEAKYIVPGSTDDPVRNPNALPTGRNPYSFDAETAPTKEAWAIARRLGNELINNYRRKNNAYPRKVGFVLWASELLKNHGVLEAEILYLMGVQPVWDSKSRVTEVKLIPADSLRRPRIDIVATTSGDYRDGFREKVMLIEEAVKLVTAADEENNYVRKNSLAYVEQLVKAGRTLDDAKRISTIRVFSPALGTYATSLQNVTKANDTWKNDTALSDLYISRMGHVYGKETMGNYEREFFVSNLRSVDAAAFSRSSNIYGLLDGTPEPVAFFGGLQLAIRNSNGGQNVDMYINNLRTPNGGKLETLDEFYHNEMQSRAFNPKWIEAMMKEDYNGAHYMQNITENLWAFNITSPNLVSDHDWDEMNNVFIKDKYGLGLSEFYEKANPYAKQTMLSTMLGAIEKGYWKADKETMVRLSKSLAESVAKNGAGCSSVICNTKSVQQFTVASLQSIPGGNALANTYLNGIHQQTQGVTAAVSNNNVSAIRKQGVAGLYKASPVAVAKVPSGIIVSGNEIVTTYEKRLFEKHDLGKLSASMRDYLVAFAVLLLLLVAGWWRQGKC